MQTDEQDVLSPSNGVEDVVTGPKLMQAILSEPENLTLDEVLRRNPHSQPHTDEELFALVKTLRLERAQAEAKKEEKREKRKEKESE